MSTSSGRRIRVTGDVAPLAAGRLVLLMKPAFVIGVFVLAGPARRTQHGPREHCGIASAAGLDAKVYVNVPITPGDELSALSSKRNFPTATQHSCGVRAVCSVAEESP